MNRRLCIPVLICLTAVACSSGSPSPSAPSAARSTGGSVFSVTSATAKATVAAADVARCLGGSVDPQCFASQTASSVVAGAGLTAPGAPGFIQYRVAFDAVTVTWSAPQTGDPVTSYTIEAGSGPGLTNLAVLATGNNATTYTVTGVPRGTYYVRVKGQNAAGFGPTTTDFSLFTITTGPCAVAPFAPLSFSSSTSGSTVTLRWEAPALDSCPPTGYRLLAGSSPTTSEYADARLGQTTQYTATGVGPGTYWLRIFSTNAYGQSTNWAETTAVVTAPTPTPTSSLTGTWVGLVSNGDGMTASADPRCPNEKFDFQLAITQSGSTISGTGTTRVVSGGVCDRAGVVDSSTFSGTASNGTFSFRVANGLSATGTYTSSRMTGSLSGGGGTGSFAVNKQ